ncbi:hypothetical protein [Bowmanella dokdonensis]|uniref:Uncharacterized protein n=1 Tax=Bowmanella dokdonensis TaxID=751969 RepID=A0A939DN38_9ALTE|nr:hypothetical protein [Bowmanella dokdonensis]MBN7825828.1 hypothetical protein [Bowmanella dokdonensis]
MNSSSPGQSGQESFADSIKLLAAALSELAAAYKDQTKCVGRIARTEWRLSVRAVVLALICMICFGSLLGAFWLSGLLLLTLALHAVSASWLLSISTTLLLQLLMLVYLVRTLHRLFARVGFSQTQQAARHLVSLPIQKAPEHAG